MKRSQKKLEKILTSLCISFLKKEQINIENVFYDTENRRFLSTPKIEEAGKNLTELKKSEV